MGAIVFLRPVANYSKLPGITPGAFSEIPLRVPSEIFPGIPPTIQLLTAIVFLKPVPGITSGIPPGALLEIILGVPSAISAEYPPGIPQRIAYP